MTQLYESQQIRELEQLAKAQGTHEDQLMLNAGTAAYTYLRRNWPEAETITVCVGKGNNGGDGYVVARLVHEAGLNVIVVNLGDPKPNSAAARAAEACVAAGVAQQPYNPFLSLSGDVIVDGLLGSGLLGPVKSPYSDFIEQINNSGIPVLALDVPSGINVDTGCVMGQAIHADSTVTFIGLKQGLYSRQAPGCAGLIHCDPLAIPRPVFSEIQPTAELLDWPMIKKLLPKRRRDAHKGDFGHVLVIGGDYGMGGAVRMAAEAAMRVGAGLVTVATRPEHVQVVSGSRPEIMCQEVANADELIPLLTKASVVVIGPGLGKSSWAADLLACVLQSDLPKLLDADALNLLSEMNVSRQQNWVLTPHPGEAGRLLGKPCADIQQDRFAAIRELQERYGGIVVLKGVGTAIKNDQPLIRICKAGNPGMASGGMGDVLSGIIGGLMAQRLELHSAAEAGVFIHALAADRAAEEGGERGLLATDLLMHLRHLVNPDRLL